MCALRRHNQLLARAQADGGARDAALRAPHRELRSGLRRENARNRSYGARGRRVRTAARNMPVQRLREYDPAGDRPRGTPRELPVQKCAVPARRDGGRVPHAHMARGGAAPHVRVPRAQRRVCRGGAARERCTEGTDSAAVIGWCRCPNGCGSTAVLAKNLDGHLTETCALRGASCRYGGSRNARAPSRWFALVPHTQRARRSYGCGWHGLAVGALPQHLLSCRRRFMPCVHKCGAKLDWLDEAAARSHEETCELAPWTCPLGCRDPALHRENITEHAAWCRGIAYDVRCCCCCCRHHARLPRCSHTHSLTHAMMAPCLLLLQVIRAGRAAKAAAAASWAAEQASAGTCFCCCCCCCCCGGGGGVPSCRASLPPMMGAPLPLHVSPDGS
jgi:hypothetical protein